MDGSILEYDSEFSVSIIDIGEMYSTEKACLRRPAIQQWNTYMGYIAKNICILLLFYGTHFKH